MFIWLLQVILLSFSGPLPTAFQAFVSMWIAVGRSHDGLATPRLYQDLRLAF